MSDKTQNITRMIDMKSVQSALVDNTTFKLSSISSFISMECPFRCDPSELSSSGCRDSLTLEGLTSCWSLLDDAAPSDAKRKEYFIEQCYDYLRVFGQEEAVFLISTVNNVKQLIQRIKDNHLPEEYKQRNIEHDQVTYKNYLNQDTNEELRDLWKIKRTRFSADREYRFLIENNPSDPTNSIIINIDEKAFNQAIDYILYFEKTCPTREEVTKALLTKFGKSKVFGRKSGY